jgi:hypothetical protein
LNRERCPQTTTRLPEREKKRAFWTWGPPESSFLYWSAKLVEIVERIKQSDSAD